MNLKYDNIVQNSAVEINGVCLWLNLRVYNFQKMKLCSSDECKVFPYCRWTLTVTCSARSCNTSSSKCILDVFKKLENLLNLKSKGRDWGEKIKIAKVRICQFHHYDWIELNVKLESFWVLIEKINPSVESKSLLVSFFCND